jgi:elongation factor G
MSNYKVEDIRNIALCGHGGCGKTTLADKLLIKTGAVTSEPSVDAGTSICDFDPEEKAHKRTIESSIVHFEHAGKRFNVIDTPGYGDFIGQTIGALRGADTAAIVVNAHSGIEVNTRRVFQEAGKAGIGRVIVINKMDEHNIDFPGLIERIRNTFGNQCVLVNVPVGHGADFKGVVSTLGHAGNAAGALVNPEEIHTALIESIVEVDEELMLKYFEGEEPTHEQLDALLIQAVAKGSLVPIVCCSAKTGAGLGELLDMFVECALPPTAVARKARQNGEEIDIQAEPAGPWWRRSSRPASIRSSRS